MAAEAPVGSRSHEVVADGARLHVEAVGVGAPLLLVHGWAMDHRVFRPQIEALSRDYRVIAFDRRGFGLSEGEPDLLRETGDIDAIARQLIGGPFHLLGMSQGGRIALRYAARHPGRLRSLILQGAAVDGEDPGGPDAERIPVAEYAALAAEGRMDEVRRRWLCHPMMRVGEGHPEAETLLRQMLADYRGEDLVRFRPEAYARSNDVLGAVAGAGLPLLVLTGARETEARRRLARLLVEKVPGAREVVLSASGHLGNLSEPDAYNRAVREFCRDVDCGD
ncbi:alpha/beta fold hydrolase [Lentisalinibacter sediminis]|uniref:alpha/beta fold hydrolase n=1 Tax=Lentisalinibacter sediminis TaxID=2992237 RepID=UPI003868383C